MSKGIYCYIDNTTNEVVYIGKDSYIHKAKRHRYHLKPSAYNLQPFNRILQNNLSRYLYKVLWEIDDCTDNHLNQMEIFYIKKYDPQFNFTEGGDGSSGFKHSEETKKKLSNINKGKNHPMYGKPRSEETKKKISKNNARYWLGKKRFEETKKKISESSSKTQSTTGFYRVTKQKMESTKQGFRWRYQYFDNNKRKAISSIDLNKLKIKVQENNLEWKIINKANAKKSLRENEVWNNG